MSELQLVQRESDVAWEEVEYEVYSDFEDSDGYESSEQMAAMREDEENTEPSSDEDEDTTAYETAVEELEPEHGAQVKYMSTRNFREIQKGEAIYQYRVQMAYEPINRLNKVKETMAAMGEDLECNAQIRHVKLRVAKQPQSHPQYSPDDKQCLLMWLKVNGLTVLAL